MTYFTDTSRCPKKKERIDRLLLPSVCCTRIFKIYFVFLKEENKKKRKLKFILLLTIFCFSLLFTSFFLFNRCNLAANERCESSHAYAMETINQSCNIRIIQDVHIRFFNAIKTKQNKKNNKRELLPYLQHRPIFFRERYICKLFWGQLFAYLM